METRANYVLIGAFALAGFLGILAFFLWFANVQLDRQLAYYDIDFESVSGLGDASDVRFAGLPVGRVVDVRLSPEEDGRVRVRVEIEADVPVRADSIATIEAQGVTGVSFVGISAGSPEERLLVEVSDRGVPMITSGRSVLQSLSQDAPEILAETLAAIRELRQLIGGDNQQRVQTILRNVEDSSASFAQALEDFSEISGTVSTFATEIDRFNSTLNTITADASEVMETADTAFAALTELSGDARTVLAEGSETLAQARQTIAATETYITEDLSPATADLRRAVGEIETRVITLSDSAEGMIATFSETGETATARLTEARATLEALDRTLGNVDSAASRFDTLLEEDAEPLIAELRSATAEAAAVISDVGEAARRDLPVIFEEIRSATARASEVVETVGSDLSAASGRIDALTESSVETLETVRETFANANETLAAINAALDTGGRALEAAERAFDGADRVMNEEIAEITASLRATLEELEATVGAVAEEIPGVTAELRAASRSAQAAFAGIEGAVGQSAPSIRAFATEALPQYGRLANETRALVDNLDTLVEQIRRDPSRFFLDPRAPEFRR